MFKKLKARRAAAKAARQTLRKERIKATMKTIFTTIFLMILEAIKDWLTGSTTTKVACTDTEEKPSKTSKTV